MALSFTGGDADRVDHGSAAAIDNIDSGTWMMWVYLDDISTSVRGFWGKGLFSSDRGIQVYRVGATGNTFRQFVKRATTSQQVESTAVLATGWQFLAGSWSVTSGGPKVYRGTETSAAVDVSTSPQDGSGAKSDESGDNLTVGVTDASGANSIPGDIAYFALTDSVLSLAEIVAQQWSMFPVRDDYLIFSVYGRGSGAGTGTQPDWSGNGNTGTVTGAVLGLGVPLPISSPFDQAVVGYPIVSAATPQSVSGTLTPAGALVRKTLKPLAGTLTPAGALARKILKPGLAGTLTPAGALVRKALKPLAGTLAPTGALSTVFIQAQSAAGTLTPAGALIRKALKPLAGTLTPAGALSSVFTFCINHDVPDLSEYTSTVTDGGDLSATVGAALAGTSGGMSVLIDDTTAIYGARTFTALTSTEYRYRFYIDPNGLTMANGNSFGVFGVYGSSSNLRGLVDLEMSGGNYQIQVMVRDDSAVSQETSPYTITDDSHFVEVRVQYASSAVANDGTLTLWIDGTQKEQVTGLDIFDVSKPNEVRLGAVINIDAGTSGTLYLDELCFRADGTEIGAAGTTQSVAGTLTPAGALIRKVLKPLVGTLTPAGALARKTLKPGLAGTLTPAGALVRKALKPLAGTLAPTGVLSTSVTLGLGHLQRTLLGVPSISMVVGAHDLSAFVRAYYYEELSQERGFMVIWLDNRDDRFDDLSTDYPDLVRGAAVTLQRGLDNDGSPLREKLPRVWIESLEYTVRGELKITCLDWWGLLEVFRYSTETTFSNQLHSAIASSILTQVGLTLDAGSFGYSTDFTASFHDDGDELLQQVMSEAHEVLHAGLDGKILYKRLDTAESSGYTYDFGDGTAAPINHPVLWRTEVAESSPRFNKVTVIGGTSRQYSGTAEDTTETALVGDRQGTFINSTLGSNAECLESATAILEINQAQATAGVIFARPHFTLRLYDVITLEAPPWGGEQIVGRVVDIIERFDLRREDEDPLALGVQWEQEIVIGAVYPMALEFSTSRRFRRRRRRRRSRGSSGGGGSGSSSTSNVPIGGIILWHGTVASIPNGWALCDGNNGTPDLTDSFILGAGSTYNPADTGGSANINIQHSHSSGTLATDNDTHSHAPGTLATATDTHGHNLQVGNDLGSGTAYAVATDTDGHSHLVDTGATATDQHGHSVTTGSTANALSSSQSVLPPYYALAYIMRVS